MYMPDELHKLFWVCLGALLGRVLAKRNKYYRGKTTIERLIAKLIDWLWEIPTIIAITLLSYETTQFLGLPERTAIIIAVVFGHIGLETLKLMIVEKIRSNY